MKKYRFTRSNVKITILSIVGIGAAFLTSWYAYQRDYGHRTALLTSASANQASGADTTISSQSQAAIPANWLTYTSPVGGFSFSYPSTWSVSGNTIPAGNGYYINVLPVSAHTPQRFDNDFTMEFFVSSNPDNTSPPMRIPSGTTQKLSNGVSVWTTRSANSIGTRPGSVCPEMELINASATHLSYGLSNGQYLALNGGYCERLKDAPTAGYDQQLGGQNWHIALEIIKSLQFK